MDQIRCWHKEVGTARTPARRMGQTRFPRRRPPLNAIGGPPRRPRQSPRRFPANGGADPKTAQTAIGEVCLMATLLEFVDNALRALQVIGYLWVAWVWVRKWCRRIARSATDTGDAGRCGLLREVSESAAATVRGRPLDFRRRSQYKRSHRFQQRMTTSRRAPSRRLLARWPKVAGRYGFTRVIRSCGSPVGLKSVSIRFFAPHFGHLK